MEKLHAGTGLAQRRASNSQDLRTCRSFCAVARTGGSSLQVNGRSRHHTVDHAVFPGITACSARQICAAAATAQADVSAPAVAAEAAAADRRADDSGAAAANDDWIEIGIIRSAHGLRGEMKVQPLTDSPQQRLGTPGDRWLQVPEAKGRRRNMPAPTAVRIASGRPSISKVQAVLRLQRGNLFMPAAVPLKLEQAHAATNS